MVVNLTGRSQQNFLLIISGYINPSLHFRASSELIHTFSSLQYTIMCFSQVVKSFNTIEEPIEKKVF